MRIADRLAWGDAAWKERGWRHPGIVFALVLLGIFGLVAESQQPPRPKGLDAEVTEFSAARAMEVLQELADAPHAVGQANHGHARDELIGELQSHGLDVEVHAGTTEGRHTTYNLLTRLDGTGPDPDTILVAAHYDSVIDAPGAADDGVGTVAIVESARALAASPPLDNDVVFLITDGEEQGLWGAWAFVAEHPLASEVDLILNYESGGPRGPVNLLEVDGADPGMIRTFARVTPRPVASSLIDDMVAAAREGGVASTDFVPFRTLGNPGYNLANSQDTGFRHSPGDSFDRIDAASVQHQGETIVGLVREYGDRDLDELDGRGEAVWISLLSWLTLAWTYRTAWLLLVLVAIGWVALVAMLRRRHGASWGGIASSFGTAFAGAVAAMVGTTAVSGLIQLLRPDHRPHMNGLRPRLEMPGIGPPGQELYWFAAMAVAAAAALVLLARARRRRTVVEMVAGGTTAFVLFAVLSTALLTGASYLFVLPLVFLIPSHALWLGRLDARTDGWPAVGAVALGAVPTVLVMASLLVYFTTFTVANAVLIAPLVALYVAQLVPVAEVVGAANPRLPLVGTGGLAGCLLVAGLFTVSAAPITESREYTGPPGRSEVTSEDVEIGAAPGWSLRNVTYDDGGHCLEVAIEPDPFVWCPLPVDVAVEVDVQLIRRGDEVLLIGNVAGTLEGTLVVRGGGQSLAFDLTRFDGIPGGAFAVTVPASWGAVDAFEVADASGAVLARRHGLQLPDEDSSLRGP